MSFADKLKQRIKAVADQAEAKFIEIKVDPAIREQRLAECNKCEYLFTMTGSCMKCGCFVKAKTMLKDASCPMGKW